MNADYFEAKKTGGSKNRIEITVDVKTDKVLDFVDEIKQAVIEQVLGIFEGRDLWERAKDGTMWSVDEEIKQAVLALK